MATKFSKVSLKIYESAVSVTKLRRILILEATGVPSHFDGVHFFFTLLKA